MSDPIYSSSVLPSSSEAGCSFDDEPSLECQGPSPALAEAPRAANACQPPLPAEPALSSATSDLAPKFLRTDHAAFIAASSPSGSDPSTPSAPPVLTVMPGQLDVQTGIPRIESDATLGNLHLHAGIDILNVSAHIGALNEDGSHGANVGWGANLLNGELTLDYKGWSLSVGAGESLGGSISSGGGRDLDADGVPERCFKVTLGPFTLGECDEL